jgi:hypothetical protein
MSIKHKYRFYIDDTRVYPVWSDSASLKWEREGEFVFLRLKLNGTFTLVNGVRKDFNLVWAQDLDHEFTFRAEYIVDGVIEETINGTFYKTDCPLWDVDNERVDVVVQTIDRYEKLMKAFDKEFDLVQVLQPEIYPVKYKKEPLIQVAFPYHSQMHQRAGNSTSIITIPSSTPAELVSFGFIPTDEKYYYIPGTADMSPDISGIYERTADYIGYPTYTRQDGMYYISYDNTKWLVNEINLAGLLVYTSLALDTAFETKSPFAQSPHLFISETTADECDMFPVTHYQRVLTDATTIGGDATIVIPSPDIGDLVFGYDRYIDQTGLVNLYVAVLPSDEHTLTPTKYGKYDEDALHFPNEYFNPNENPYIGTKSYTVLNPAWTQYALMEFIAGGYNDELSAAASDITLRDAYALADVIKLLLAQIDSTLYFEATAFGSDFLFNTTNPITGLPQALTHFITPKSNVTINDYSQPDTGEMITFADIDRLLKAVNLFWWVDRHGNFRIEHIKYFKNGLRYDSPYIGVNLTTLQEPRTGKFWGYHTNKFRYTKEKMPEQIAFGWMDKQSEYFDGYPIKINSGFVEKGFIQDMKVGKFSSDLSLAVAFPDNFSIDGFFVMGAEFVGGDWIVPFETFSVGTFTNILVQNGFWSFYYLHNNFWKHNLPAEDANINNVDIVALSTKRGKEQTLVFPAGVQPDPMRLVTSGIGNCEVDEMEIFLASRKCTIKALGDLDFNNPCPTC